MAQQQQSGPVGDGAGQASGDLAGVGEFGLIASVTALLTAGPDVLIGPGDDAALVRVGGGADGREVLVSTDIAVEGRHFRRDWSSAEDVGHRVAAANLSDIAAMGGTATALVIALAAPTDLPAAWALDLTRGLVAEADRSAPASWAVTSSSADVVTVAVTVLGACTGPVVRRTAPSPVTSSPSSGRLGWAAAGLAVLSRGFRSPRVVVEAHRRPEPPYAQGPVAAAAGATAMIDVSDGLLADLGHVATASGVAVDVRQRGVRGGRAAAGGGSGPRGRPVRASCSPEGTTTHWRDVPLRRGAAGRLDGGRPVGGVRGHRRRRRSDDGDGATGTSAELPRLTGRRQPVTPTGRPRQGGTSAA